MFLCYYVHDSIVFITNCFITLSQHVRGQSALCCQINVCMYISLDSVMPTKTAENQLLLATDKQSVISFFQTNNKGEM